MEGITVTDFDLIAVKGLLTTIDILAYSAVREFDIWIRFMYT